MLASQRHEMIVEIVHQQGTVRVRDLATTLEVSEMTVRRDLETLAGQGRIDKVHGGATVADRRSTAEPGFEAKQRRQEAEKAAIARAAVELVRPGASIGLTAGTTTWTLATHLVAVEALTIVTNSPLVAQVGYAAQRADLTVVLTGGVRTPSDALVGPVATTTLSSLHLDVVFMGVHGMDTGHGYSTPNLAEAEVNRAFVAATDNLVVVADHTKWRTPGLAKVAELDAASLVVSDHGLADEAVEAFAELDVPLELTVPERRAPRDGRRRRSPRTSGRPVRRAATDGS